MAAALGVGTMAGGIGSANIVLAEEQKEETEAADGTSEEPADKLSPLSLLILYSAMRKQRSKRRSPMKRKRRSRRTMTLTKWRNINFV